MGDFHTRFRFLLWVACICVCVCYYSAVNVYAQAFLLSRSAQHSPARTRASSRQSILPYVTGLPSNANENALTRVTSRRFVASDLAVLGDIDDGPGKSGRALKPDCFSARGNI